MPSRMRGVSRASPARITQASVGPGSDRRAPSRGSGRSGSSRRSRGARSPPPARLLVVTRALLRLGEDAELHSSGLEHPCRRGPRGTASCSRPSSRARCRATAGVAGDRRETSPGRFDDRNGGRELAGFRSNWPRCRRAPRRAARTTTGHRRPSRTRPARPAPAAVEAAGLAPLSEALEAQRGIGGRWGPAPALPSRMARPRARALRPQLASCRRQRPAAHARPPASPHRREQHDADDRHAVDRQRDQGAETGTPRRKFAVPSIGSRSSAGSTHPGCRTPRRGRRRPGSLASVAEGALDGEVGLGHEGAVGLVSTRGRRRGSRPARPRRRGRPARGRDQGLEHSRRGTDEAASVAAHRKRTRIMTTGAIPSAAELQHAEAAHAQRMPPRVRAASSRPATPHRWTNRLTTTSRAESGPPEARR